MPALTLTGPSYKLRSTNAETRRTIGWMPVLIESQTGKGGATSYLKQQPGLTRLADLGGAVVSGGLHFADGKLYAVSGGRLLEVASDWTTTNRGAVAGGDVSMAANATQLCVVSRPNGYVYDFSSHSLQVLSENWRGSVSVDFLSGYGVFTEPDTRQFYLSGAEDFTSLNALDFASAEGSNGNIIAALVKHRELLLLKEATAEVWYDAGGSDFAFARNDGAAIEVGCVASKTACKLNGVAYWLGRDDQGSAIVFAMAGYAPARISNHALEEQLSALSDLSEAHAFAYHQEGLSFYVLNVPGLDTTWVYEVASGIWHERAEWVDGAYRPWRVVAHAYAYGKHVVADAEGVLYELDPETVSNDGDVLLRDLITPHNAASGLARKRVSSLQIDCDVAYPKADLSAGSLMLRYSDDGGRNWGSWRSLSLGGIGRTKNRVRTVMLGSARDRVWHFRVTDAVMCNLISAVFDER